MQRAIESRDENNDEVDETEIDDEELDLERDDDLLDESIIRLLEDDESGGLFYEEDGKAIFESTENQHKVKLVVEKDSNVSLKYDNNGVVTEGNHNSGGNVMINIIQQWS